MGDRCGHHQDGYRQSDEGQRQKGIAESRGDFASGITIHSYIKILSENASMRNIVNIRPYLD